MALPNYQVRSHGHPTFHAANWELQLLREHFYFRQMHALQANSNTALTTSRCQIQSREPQRPSKKTKMVSTRCPLTFVALSDCKIDVKLGRWRDAREGGDLLSEGEDDGSHGSGSDNDSDVPLATIQARARKSSRRSVSRATSQSRPPEPMEVDGESRATPGRRRSARLATPAAT